MNEILTSIGNAISLTKRLKEISKNIGDAEFKIILADLSLELADTKLSLAEVIEQNAHLKLELTQLKHSQTNKSEKLVFKDFAYYSEDNDGPFCPACYDNSEKK